ncbi:MAG: class I SAM-dependent methyltransferase [Candidatus Melainabacteria bacterium HGW-Melainabacteria-1]|nr:MAG: class I SAM-dependent methyltransferase [Candidatus Melainabacteria bacterium HGW-Melainabacteria-1]
MNQTPKQPSGHWDEVAGMMRDEERVQFGPYTTYWMRHSPRRALHYLAYYKFAAKLIGADKQVLDIGCAEGLGTWLLACECGGLVEGLDLDPELVGFARKNWSDPRIRFECADILTTQLTSQWQALVSFDVIEHILPDHVENWWAQLHSALSHDGIAIIGTPSEISQQHASEISRIGHVNIYSAERLEAEMREHFHHVFMFAAHDEVVHTGYLPLAHYLIAVGVRPRQRLS